VRFAPRNALVRKIAGVSIAVVTFAAPGLLLAAAPASAAVVAPACESHGNFCVGAPTLGANDPVQETQSGRTISFVNQGGNSYLLEINATTGAGMTKLCVAASNADNFGVLHPCNGGSAVIWKAEQGPDGLSCLFDNQKFAGSYLTGSNSSGAQFTMSSGTAGGFKQFKLTSGPSGTGTVTLSAVSSSTGAKDTCGT
jgi:hypothetical protein